MNEHIFRAMGSEIALIADCSSEQLAVVPPWFEAWEATLSRFRPTSELMQLNRTSQQWVAVSAVLWDVVQLALAAARLTDGLVVPTILPALLAAGYDRSFELIADVQACSSPFSIGDWREIRTNQQKIWLPTNVQLDLGGVGKSWAAQRTLNQLNCEHALVDVGGDIALKGGTPDGEAWQIDVQHPFDPDGIITTLEIESGGVATSGRDYRTWLANGKPQHHLIDPRTGLPATTDIMSVTVIAESVIEAEIAAKAVFLQGIDAGTRWIGQQTALEWIIVSEQGDVLEGATADLIDDSVIATGAVV